MPFIIAGVDGSETAFQALTAAVEQATHSGAEVRAVNVVVLPAVSGYEFGPTDLDIMQQAATEMLASAMAHLDEVYAGDVPVKVSTEVRIGHIGRELADAAEAHEGAAMIVAGSRGYGGVKSMLLGSTTTYLAHHLSCPLLIIPTSV